MPASITSVPPNPPICAFVSSVGGLVFSLMLTGVGFANNAWIVYQRSNYNDAFQRGIRGHDCYQPGEAHIKCLPWEFANKSAKFPSPFDKVLEASNVVHVAYWFAVLIIACQIFWIAYTLGHCCSLKFSKIADKYKLLFFHFMVFPVGLWIILFGLILYETYTDKIFPRPLVPTESTYKIGHGCWLFFLGGLIPFIMALYFLFDDQIQTSKDKIRALVFRRQQVPTNEEELVTRFQS
uniref:Uncharacterized protein n=1 Tax=Caenorhabditis japonica TaxID=281687 RepID=A0A8R1E7X3_CAEJA